MSVYILHDYMQMHNIKYKRSLLLFSRSHLKIPNIYGIPIAVATTAAVGTFSVFVVVVVRVTLVMLLLVTICDVCVTSKLVDCGINQITHNLIKRIFFIYLMDKVNKVRVLDDVLFGKLEWHG